MRQILVLPSFERSVKVEDDNYYLVLVGSHDEIKQYLRKVR